MNRYKWYLILIVLLGITLVLQVCAKHQFLPITNHIIPDSQAYEMRVLYDLTGKDFFADALTSYNRILYSFGSFSFFCTNSIMLLLSVYLCKIFSCISPASISIARFIIVFNPYLLIGAVGPNKETMIIFVSLLCFYLLFQNLTILQTLGCLIAILTLFIRPIAGMVLILTISMVPFIMLLKNPLRLFLFILMCYFILNAVPFINDTISSMHGEDDELPYFQGSNILEVAVILKVMNQNPILQFPAFIAKTGLILITPIFRPNPFFSLPFGLLDAGYSMMAFFLLPFNIALLLLFFNKKRASIEQISLKSQMLIFYCLLGILTAILSANITFRYIFPYSPIIVSLFYLHPVNIRNKIIKYCICLLLLTFSTTAIIMRKEFELDTGSGMTAQFISWL